MEMQSSQGTVQVSLPISFINALLQMHEELVPEVIQSLKERAIEECQSGPEVALPTTAGKYSAEFLGVGISATTLPEIFSQIVDLMAEVAPDALEILAKRKSRKRRFIARDRHNIHPGRSDLRVIRTSSGWWMSGNIGSDDLKRALRELATAAGLAFGRDVVFPAIPDGD